MTPDTPGVQLLLLSGLAIYWLIPLSSWLMLRGNKDRNARLWFFATALYSVTATIFVFRSWFPGLFTPPLTAVLSLASVFIMLRSLELESDAAQASRVRLYIAILATEFLVLFSLHWLEAKTAIGPAIHLVVISVTEMFLIAEANRVRRQYQSQAMWILMVTFLAFLSTNLARVGEFLLTGRFSFLLDFTATSNASLIVNYLSVVFYCYGYWGFVVEKNRGLAIKAAEEAGLAKANERLAVEREELSQALLHERTQLMEQLAKIGKLAQSGALSAAIAHQVNQPLAAIRLNIQECQRMAQEARVSADLQKLLTRIESDNQRVAAIVQHVRDLFSAHSLPARKQILDDIVREIVLMQSPRLKEGQVKVHLQLNASTPFEFVPGEVEHILTNLLDNALDAVQSQPSNQRHINIRTWFSEKSLYLAVSDSGPGIPASLANRIFDLFDTHKAGGMGVGLWLARYIAERHGGSLEIDASHAPGACMVLRLPSR